MKIANKLIQSANEALAIAKGNQKPAGMYVPETVDVADKVASLNLGKDVRENVGKMSSCTHNSPCVVEH